MFFFFCIVLHENNPLVEYTCIVSFGRRDALCWNTSRGCTFSFFLFDFQLYQYLSSELYLSSSWLKLLLYMRSLFPNLRARSSSHIRVRYFTSLLSTTVYQQSFAAVKPGLVQARKQICEVQQQQELHCLKKPSLYNHTSLFTALKRPSNPRLLYFPASAIHLCRIHLCKLMIPPMHKLHSGEILYLLLTKSTTWTLRWTTPLQNTQPFLPSFRL